MTSTSRCERAGDALQTRRRRAARGLHIHRSAGALLAALEGMKRSDTTVPPPAATLRAIQRGPKKPRPAIDAEDLGDDDELPGGVVDPLAAEPLSMEEIRLIEARDNGMDEQREGALQVLRKGTEADLHAEVDDADALGLGKDESLVVHPEPPRTRTRRR